MRHKIAQQNFESTPIASTSEDRVIDSIESWSLNALAMFFTILASHIHVSNVFKVYYGWYVSLWYDPSFEILNDYSKKITGKIIQFKYD